MLALFPSILNQPPTQSSSHNINHGSLPCMRQQLIRLHAHSEHLRAFYKCPPRFWTLLDLPAVCAEALKGPFKEPLTTNRGTKVPVMPTMNDPIGPLRTLRKPFRHHYSLKALRVPLVYLCLPRFLNIVERYLHAHQGSVLFLSLLCMPTWEQPGVHVRPDLRPPVCYYPQTKTLHRF